MPQEHLVVGPVDIDLNLELLELFLVNLGFRPVRQLDMTGKFLLEHKVVKLHLKNGLVNLIASLLNLFSPVCILQYIKYTEAILPDFEHLTVGFNFIFGLLTQLHLFLLSFSESRERVVIIVVCFFPKHAHEGALAFFTFIFPIL